MPGSHPYRRRGGPWKRRGEDLGLVGHHVRETRQYGSPKQVDIVLDSYGFSRGEEREDFLSRLSENPMEVQRLVADAYRLAAQLDVKGQNELTTAGQRRFFMDVAIYLASVPAQDIPSSHLGVLPGSEPKLLVGVQVSGNPALVPFGDLDISRKYRKKKPILPERTRAIDGKRLSIFEIKWDRGLLLTN